MEPLAKLNEAVTPAKARVQRPLKNLRLKTCRTLTTYRVPRYMRRRRVMRLVRARSFSENGMTIKDFRL